MKPSRLVIIIACLSIVCAMFTGVVFALESDEARVSVVWSTETAYPGSTAAVTVLFINDSPEVLTVYYFGFHFDWFEADEFYGVNLSSSANPVTVGAYNSTMFSPVTIQIPENATAGAHTYFVGVDGIEGESTQFTWDSATMYLVVQNSGQDVYGALVAQVASDIADAVDANYQSSSAKSFLSQAQDAYSQALDYADADDLDSAIAELQDASLYLDQAESEEESYVPPESGLDSLILVVAIVVFVAVVVLVVIMTLKNRKQESPVEQPTLT